MIRGKLQKDILAQLDSHPKFESSDFKLNSSVKSDGDTILQINFIPNPIFKISFRIPNTLTEVKESYRSTSHYSIKGSVCPGPLSYEETFSIYGEDEIFTKIGGWIKAIWEELSSSPVVKQIEAHEAEINKLYEQFEEMEDEQFTKAEASELKKKLDEVEAMLKEQLQQHSQDKAQLQKDISQLHGDIETLKETINSFNKKGWLRTFTSRLFKWTKDAENRKMLADGFKVVKEFLPEHVKSSLPEQHSIT